MESRYQDQLWYIRWYRWILYYPITMLQAVWTLYTWWLQGCQIPESYTTTPAYTKWQFAKVIWHCYRGLADEKMQHIYTMKEALESLHHE